MGMRLASWTEKPLFTSYQQNGAHPQGIDLFISIRVHQQEIGQGLVQDILLIMFVRLKGAGPMHRETCSGKQKKRPKSKTDGSEMSQITHAPCREFFLLVTLWGVLFPLFVAANGIGEQVVRGFYESLSEGDGDRAVYFLSPKKRLSKNFRPEALAKYYGGMNEPIRLKSLEHIHNYEYLVSYHFLGHGVTCDGRATVYLEESSKGIFIERILAHDGC